MVKFERNCDLDRWVYIKLGHAKQIVGENHEMIYDKSATGKLVDIFSTEMFYQ